MQHHGLRRHVCGLGRNLSLTDRVNNSSNEYGSEDGCGAAMKDPNTRPVHRAAKIVVGTCRALPQGAGACSKWIVMICQHIEGKLLVA
jgi:hypothetical protein